MANIAKYRLIPTEGMDKVVETTGQTAGYFPGGGGNITSAEIHTSSLSDTNEQYYFNITKGHPLSSSTENIYSVSYGHRGGSGSKILTNEKGETQAIYGQWSETLLAPSEITGGFGISKAGSSGVHNSAGKNDDDIYILTGKRNLYKEKINPANWTVRLSGSLSDMSGTSLQLTDDMKHIRPTATPAGPRYNIVSGSDGSVIAPATTRTFGWFYPYLGTLVFSAAELSASIPGFSGSKNVAVDYNRDISVSVTGSTASQSRGFVGSSLTDHDQHNALNFVNCLRQYNGSNVINMRSEENINKVSYICRLKSGEANFSNNPTFVSGSLNELRQLDMIGNPQTFVTGVTLWDNAKNPIAMAKLSSPIQNNFSSELVLKITLSY